MTRYIYLVNGTTSSYGADLSVWAVAAYDEREPADMHVKILNARLRKMRCYCGHKAVNVSGRAWRATKEASMHDMDLGCRIDTDGTIYAVVKVPLLQHPDQYQEEVLEEPVVL